MGNASESFVRSTLHDMANVLAGVRGILDLNLPGQPLSERDRDRLGAVIEEGVVTLDRSRHLTMGTLPTALPEAGPLWRQRLLEALGPMGTLFRCTFEITYEGPPEWDQWPGDLLLGYAQAITRQALPYSRTGTLRIRCEAGPDRWLLHWSPAAHLPETLNGDPQMTPDICSRWAQRVGPALGARLSFADGTLQACIPRRGDQPDPAPGDPAAPDA
jgi:hypothetical protein